jgi:hypothetical protein
MPLWNNGLGIALLRIRYITSPQCLSGRANGMAGDNRRVTIGEETRTVTHVAMKRGLTRIFPVIGGAMSRLPKFWAFLQYDLGL